MNTITIIVAVPTRTLCANGRVHWGTLSAAKKQARNSAKIHAIEAVMAVSDDAPNWKKATVSVKAFFRDKRSKWDRDNFIGSLKATLDGIADAGVIENDRGVSWGDVDLSGIDKTNPRVELTFQAIEERAAQ